MMFIRKRNQIPLGYIQISFGEACVKFIQCYLIACMHYQFMKACKQVSLGSQDGSLQLWNIIIKKYFYDLKGWKSSICCCVSSPALDVVSVGCVDGMISCSQYSLGFRKKWLLLVKQLEVLYMIALSFRTGFMLMGDTFYLLVKIVHSASSLLFRKKKQN